MLLIKFVFFYKHSLFELLPVASFDHNYYFGNCLLTARTEVQYPSNNPQVHRHVLSVRLVTYNTGRRYMISGNMT